MSPIFEWAKSLDGSVQLFKGVSAVTNE